jgi:hypothetical protein
MLDVAFLPEGGVRSITQTGNLAYVGWHAEGLGAAGRIHDRRSNAGAERIASRGGHGMTTTAQTIRMNRATGDAIAEGNVKSTYSDLKPQPDGAMLASSDPIHVTSRSMTAHHSPAIAVYTGDARLWQDANIVEAPTLQFDRDHRSLIAHGERVDGAEPRHHASFGPTGFDRAGAGGQERQGDPSPHHIGASELRRCGAEEFFWMAG